MPFYADLHVHSRFSRATSRECDLERLSLWAQKKGVTVLGTGDFTHPAWFGELKEKLVPAEPGLFRLRPELEREVERRLDASCRLPTRFLLSVEISTIYGKGGRTRKVHHLVYAPDFETAGRVVRRLSRIGNLASDGRPILGLDSRDLLEIVLESGSGAYLVPAHAWTPWFSVLGSKAGFDSVDECYGDLAPHVFALETGLSSDPPMNWRLSALDRFRLVSNSDAHSPDRLGREACAFDTALDYFSLRAALETGTGYAGTVEFFAEEGKYHLDGHRACRVRLAPVETRRADGRCPGCGRPVTVGVLHRVEDLADRPEGVRPAGAAPFRSLIPLREVLAEIEGTGPASRAVERVYETLLARLGPELVVLEAAPVEEVRRAGPSLLAEAIARMRQGRVIREAGYDGEYGVIRLFSADELARGRGVGLLFPMAAPQAASTETDEPSPVGSLPGVVEGLDLSAPSVPGEQAPGGRGSARPASGRPVVGESARPAAGVAAEEVHGVAAARDGASTPEAADERRVDGSVLAGLDPEQRAAAEHVTGPLLVIAGPGTGKTRTLTHRIAHLVAGRGVAPEQCLALTFTRRAADEMKARLATLLPETATGIPVMTFHALGLAILRADGHRLGLRAGVRVAPDRERTSLLAEATRLPERRAERLLTEISRLKRTGSRPASGTELAAAWAAYEQALRARGLVDLDDLVGLAVQLLESEADLAAHYRDRYPWISIDEYQDIDERQYRLVRLLVPPGGNVCAIGDPDQAIYGFRGADVRFFLRFQDDFPGARVVRLGRSYRSSRVIVDAARQVIAGSSLVEPRALQAAFEGPSRIVIHQAASEGAEAEFVVETIERLVGGSTFFSVDSGRAEGEPDAPYAFADFAVLYRADAQAGPLCEALVRSGIPFQKRSHRHLSDQPAVEALVRLVREMKATGPVAERLVQATGACERVGRGTDPAAAGRAAEMRAAAELLMPLAESCGKDLDRFVAELAMGAQVDAWDPRAARVSLLTLHAAKGLEFRVVFIVGCEDGLLPLRWARAGQGAYAEAGLPAVGEAGAEAPAEAGKPPVAGAGAEGPGGAEPRLRRGGAEAGLPAVDEERRLFYVGMTRTRERLFLSYARRRLWRGEIRQAEASPFLRDIEEALLARYVAARRRPAARRASRQLKLF